MRVVFVCTGNICRSPLAESLLAHRLRERGIDGVEVSSSGLFARAGRPAVPAAVRAAGKIGIDLSAHRSRQFSADAVRPGDLVLVMEEMQRRQLLARHPVDPIAVRMLGRMAPAESNEIDDPLGGPDIAFERCVERLGACIDGLLSWLEDERISRA